MDEIALPPGSEFAGLAGDKMRIVETDDGHATISFDHVGTGRSCSDCQLCCKLLPVPAVEKGAGERCRHQRVHKGCSIYADRPWSCRTWACRWLADAGTVGMSRPDRCHYVIDLMYDTIRSDSGASMSAMQIWVDPAFPDAHKDPDLRAFIEARGQKWGIIAIVRWNASSAMVLVPPSLSGRGWLEIKPGALTPRAEAGLPADRQWGSIEPKLAPEAPRA